MILPRATPEELAADYLLAAKTNDVAAAGRTARTLADLDANQLAASLSGDPSKLAFWINVYNAAVVLQPDHKVGSTAGRARFFRRRSVEIAGTKLSLDAVEHGILRGSRLKISLGYVANPFASAFVRKHRVTRVDASVHFALNCAAASCPPIAAYESDDIDAQLDSAARSYLKTGVVVEADRIVVPRIFLWFLGDFGGFSGVRSFLIAHGVDVGDRRMGFAPFDWTPDPGRFVSSEDGGTVEAQGLSQTDASHQPPAG